MIFGTMFWYQVFVYGVEGSECRCEANEELVCVVVSETSDLTFRGACRICWGDTDASTYRLDHFKDIDFSIVNHHSGRQACKLLGSQSGKSVADGNFAEALGK